MLVCIIGKANVLACEFTIIVRCIFRCKDAYLIPYRQKNIWLQCDVEIQKQGAVHDE